MEKDYIINAVSETLVRAGSTFTQDKTDAYRRAIEAESNGKARWVMETILRNAEAAEKNKSPLCDDTGIPHILIDVGESRAIPAGFLDAVQEGVAVGLRRLPGRSMGIMGEELQRLDQSGGLSNDPGFVAPAPFQIRKCAEDVLRITIMMFGGGPAIRGRTYRVYHKHSVSAITDEIVEWASEAVGLLGCSPCTLAVGIGRSQYEAAALMEQALADGNYNIQTSFEQGITDRVNQGGIGALGLGGDISVIGTFVKIGPQRASGVRVVCLRPCCCFEPRIASIDL